MKNIRNMNTRKSLTAMAARILEDARQVAELHAGELFEDASSGRDQEALLSIVRQLREANRLMVETLKRTDPARDFNSGKLMTVRVGDTRIFDAK